MESRTSLLPALKIDAAYYAGISGWTAAAAPPIRFAIVYFLYLNGPFQRFLSRDPPPEVIIDALLLDVELSAGLRERGILFDG